MPHHKIAYRTEDGTQIAERLRYVPTRERLEIPVKGDVVELDGRLWKVKELRLFPTTDSAVVVVEPAQPA